jgi:hypothetical protein
MEIRHLAEFFAIHIGANYESVARFWVSNKKNSALNSITSATLWCIWKFRNSMVFDNVHWLNIKQVWFLLMRTVKHWSNLSQGVHAEKMLAFCHLSQKLYARIQICG